MNNKYETFFNFLGSRFPDMDFEGMSDEDVVKKYKQTINAAELCIVVAEAQEVRQRVEQYWKVIIKETNLYFKNYSEASLWLDSIISLLKKKDS